MIKEKAVRDSNIELLRIVLMMMIIMHHLITRGCGLREMIGESGTFEASATTWIQLLINSFIICAVNAYVFISGYFGIQFRAKRLLLLVTQALFYSFGLYLLMSGLGYVDFSLREIVKSLLPISRSMWWFFNCFFALYIFSPILNKGLSVLKKGQIVTILILLFYLGYVKFIPDNMVSGKGFSVFSFIFIYILAYFLRRFEMNLKKPFLIYFMSSLVIFVAAYSAFIYDKIEWSWSMFSYNNPLVLVAAVGLFYTFKNFRIQKNWINIISSFTFGIYLFHEVEYVNPVLANVVQYLQGIIETPILFFCILFVFMLLIFVIGMGLDKIRQWLCEPLVNYLLSRRLVRKAIAYIES